MGRASACALIWQTTGLGRNVTPMPEVADGMVIVMSGYQAPNLLALPWGREGDLTGTDAIFWQNQPGNSYTPSPVLQHLALHSVERTPLVTRKLMAGALTCILKPIARP